MRLFNILELFIFPSVLVAILVLISPLLKNRVKPVVRYALWLLVVIRMAFPVSFPSVPFLSINPTENDNQISKEIDKLPQKSPLISDAIDPDSSASDVLDGQKETLLTIGDAISLRGFWIIGSSIMFIFFVSTRIYFYIKLRKYHNNKYECDSKIPVYIMNNRHDCFMFGFFFKRIYIGQSMIDDGLADFTIAHFTSHAKHLDNIWLLVRVILLTAYWFHPAVWIAASHAQRAGEYACNMLTVDTIGKEKYPEYKEFVIGLSRIMPRPVFWEQFVCLS